MEYSIGHLFVIFCVYKTILIVAEFWEQPGIWNFIDKNSTVYINNTSENILLGHFEADKAELVSNSKNHSENLWKIGTLDNDGYFNLTHLESEKLLTATSSPSNNLKVDKSMYQRGFEH